MNAAMTPRRKRWYRPRNVLLVLAAALLIPLGWASHEVWLVHTAVVHPSVDYRAELRKLSEEAAGVSAAAADDAWFLLLDILEDAEAVRTDVEAQIAIEGFDVRLRSYVRRPRVADTPAQAERARLGCSAEAHPMNAAMTPRRKRWYRPRNVLLVLAAALLIPLGWASHEVWLVHTAVVHPSVDYRAELRKLSEEAAGVSAAAADDAWFLLLDILEDAEAVRTDVEAQIAIEGFEPRDEYDDGTIDYTVVLYGRSLPDDIAPERRAIDMLRERGVFERFDRFARGSPGLRPPTGDGPFFLDLHRTELGQARALARARTASMRVALADGDLPEVATALEQLLALARTISYQPQLLSYLTALAIRALALSELRLELSEAEFDQIACRSLLEAMDRHATLAPLDLPLEAERLHFYDKLQWTFSDDGRGNGYLVSFPDEYLPVSVPTANLSIFDAISSRFLDASRAELAGLYDEMIDGLLERHPHRRCTGPRSGPSPYSVDAGGARGW